MTQEYQFGNLQNLLLNFRKIIIVKNPILLKIDFDGGHGIDNPKKGI